MVREGNHPCVPVRPLNRIIGDAMTTKKNTRGKKLIRPLFMAGCIALFTTACDGIGLNDGNDTGDDSSLNSNNPGDPEGDSVSDVDTGGDTVVTPEDTMPQDTAFSDPSPECEEMYDGCTHGCEMMDIMPVCDVSTGDDTEVGCAAPDTDGILKECLLQCGEQLNDCIAPPRNSCEDNLAMCLADCRSGFSCVSDDSETPCMIEDFDGVLYRCEEGCYMEDDECADGPDTEPTDACEDKYHYCIDECAWDDKFCHDHCYETFYYCEEGAQVPEAQCNVICADGDAAEGCWYECCESYGDDSKC